MSPAALRTYRAERMLERDFHALRASVLAIVAARLRAGGGSLDNADLEACYASAWQGLYGATVRGETIANPAAWLALVTYRRAIEELRAPRRSEAELDTDAAVEPDVDGALDDRARLRQLIEGMRCRLDLREREAAALCYLHGFSRAEAARQMGISETRMRKLMEGRGAGRAGVSQKIGALVQTIDAGEFCREQDSLLRALAFGVLEHGGERHRIALAHTRGCPACRRRVALLRRLAVALPPVLTLPGAGKAGLAALAAGASHGAGAGVAPLSGAGSMSAGAPLGASAAAGGGAAGGGWALGGGGLAAKLAAGCLLALGVGAGCVTLGHSGAHRRDGRRAAGPISAAPRAAPPGADSAPSGVSRPARTSSTRASVPGAQRAAGGQSREFTPERAPAAHAAGPAHPPAAHSATAPRAGASGPRQAPPATEAEREFAPG